MHEVSLIPTKEKNSAIIFYNMASYQYHHSTLQTDDKQKPIVVDREGLVIVGSP